MMRHVTLSLATAATALGLLTGCAEDPKAAIAPLISNTDGSNVVNSRVAADVQAALESAADGIIEMARPVAAFEDLSILDINEVVLEPVIVEATRNVNEYGGGSEILGWKAQGNSAYLVATSENGACWVLRLTGPPSESTLSYSALFDPGCNADKASTTDLKWSDSWPATPTPDVESIPSDAPTSGLGPAPKVDESGKPITSP